MKTDEIKKGQRVELCNGWQGTMNDNRKGDTREVIVEGHYREIGSIYSHDIAKARNTSGEWELVEHTSSQDTMRQLAGEFGLGHMPPAESARKPIEDSKAEKTNVPNLSELADRMANELVANLNRNVMAEQDRRQK